MSHLRYNTLSFPQKFLITIMDASSRWRHSLDTIHSFTPKYGRNYRDHVLFLHGRLICVDLCYTTLNFYSKWVEDFSIFTELDTLVRTGRIVKAILWRDLA
jgi:hypothetical protein